MSNSGRLNEHKLKEIQNWESIFFDTSERFIVVTVWPAPFRSTIYSKRHIVLITESIMKKFFDPRGVKTITWSPSGIGATGGPHDIIGFILSHQVEIINLIGWLPSVVAVAKWAKRRLVRRYELKMSKKLSGFKPSCGVTISYVAKGNNYSANSTNMHDLALALPDLIKLFNDELPYAKTVFTISVVDPDMQPYISVEFRKDINEKNILRAFKMVERQYIKGCDRISVTS